jgi:cell division protein FtsN
MIAMKSALILSVLVIMISFGSCKNGGGIFGKSKETEAQIANLERENQALRNELENIEEQHMAEITEIRTDYESKLANLQKQIEAGTMAEYDAYYVITGSFKNKIYAEEYSKKMKELGYEGNIISGPNNFNLVTYGTYNTLKSAIAPMRKAKEDISIEAWIYFKN